MSQAEKMQELKANPQQQKMLNEILAATNEAIKKEFPVFAKLVQADVSYFIMQSAGKDGQLSAPISDFAATVNEMMGQVGKDLEKQMMDEFKALAEKTCK